MENLEQPPKRRRTIKYGTDDSSKPHFIHREQDEKILRCVQEGLSLHKKSIYVNPSLFQDEDLAVSVKRNNTVRLLSRKLDDLFHEAGSSKGAPNTAFTRWLVIQKFLDPDGDDPVLPSSPDVDVGLVHEMVESLKVKPDRAVECCKRFSEYVKNRSSNRQRDNNTPFRVEREGRGYRFSAHGCTLFLNGRHYDALQTRYKRWCQESSNPTGSGESADGPPREINDIDLFHKRVFLLLSRYDTLGGPGYQAALPVRMFDLLQDTLGVSHECFASPLNATLNSFCSAFPDTDHYFGSVGNFFDMESSFFSSGSYEANPPFVEEIILAMALTIDMYMVDATGPLSFIVIVAGWDDTPGYHVMKKSPYLKHFKKYYKYKHDYREGYQHKTKNSTRRSAADSFVFILQNESGSSKWPVSNDIVRKIDRAF